MDGKRRTPVSPVVAAGEKRSILPAKESSVPTHGIMCSNIHMEIENPKSAVFVPLLGAFNFEHKSMGALGIPDEFSFLMDWTKGGEGQDVLREHLRAGFGSLIRVKQQGKQYQGMLRFESGINTNDGMVVVEVAR
jgi:hypothetical protein